jgi:ABC-type Fe3+ transport system permease subunit
MLQHITNVFYSFGVLTIQGGADAARGNGQVTDLFGAGGIFSTITSVLLFVVGAISVIMIVIGGLRYVISGGNSSAISAAKNTILYAVIGLVVAILAYALIHFVLTSFGSGSGASGGTNV